MSDDDRDIDIESDVSSYSRGLKQDVLEYSDFQAIDIHVCLSLTLGGRRLGFEAKAF